MPVYTIEGKRVRTDKPLTDAEIDEIAASFKPAPAPAAAAPAPAAPRRLTLPGDRATGFREVVEEAGTPEERVAMARQLPQYALALGAGPLLGGAARGAALAFPRAAPALRGVVAPILESGGFQTGLPATAPRAAQLAARAAGGAAVGGAGAAAMAPEDTSYGATTGAALSLLAPPLVSRFAGAVGSSVDWLGGKTADIRAARMLRGVLPDEQINALRQAVLAAPEGTPPSRVISQMDLPASERRPVEVLQALLAKAEAKDPQGVANAFRVAEGEALSNRLAAIAGGETAEAALTTRRGATEALRTGTGPLREEAFAAARRTGEVLPKLDTISQSARAEASRLVDVVRKAERQTAAADEWARTWGVGGARQPGAPRPPTALTYPGELKERAGRVGEAAAEASLRAGGAARAAENTARSMRDRGLQPIETRNLTSALTAKLDDPEIGTNREAATAIPRIVQMLDDWTNERGVITPEALYAIRKNGVAGVIRELNPGMDAKSQDRFAAQVLSNIKPLFDDAIVNAGGKTWPQYLRDYEMGMTQIRAMELADTIRKDYASGTASAAAKRKIADLVRGESPDVVEELFGSGKYKISEQMARDMPVLRELADSIGFDLKFAAQAKAGKEALGELAKEQRGWRLRFPFFTRASTAVNEIAMALEDKVANETMAKIIGAAQSGKNFDAAIAALPATERVKVLTVMRTPADWNRFATGVATAASGAAVAEPRNALAPENQNALAE